MKKIFSELKLKTPIIILSIFLGLFCFAKISQAATYYVSTSGNDSNTGTSASPWRTIQKAANTLVAGDTVIVNAGTYNERVNVSRSGISVSSMITFSANGTVHMAGFYLSGDYIKVTGFDIETNTASRYNGTGFFLEGADGCLIDSNTVHDCTDRGIFLWEANNNTISNNTITRTAETAMWVTGNNNLIENNDISDTRNTIKGITPASMQADGIRFPASGSYNGSGNVYRGNYIHGFSYANQNYSGEPPHIDAFQGNTTNTIIERNHVVMMEDAVHANTSMHGLMIEGGSNLTIKNNIFEVHSFMNTGGGPNITNLYIYNNTIRSSLNFWDDPYTPYCFQLDYVTGTVEIKNNISVDFELHYYKTSHSTATVTRNNNCIFNSNDSTPGMSGLSADPTDLWKQDALFVNEWSDLKLQSSSPCKDAGITIASVTDDYLGVSRPQGSAYDIGAYEFVGTPSDTQAPTIPINLSATAVSSTQINLSWTASTDNVGVTGYRIYRGGTQVGTSAVNNYSNTGLSPSTTYSYTVAAYDAAGNVSAQSASVNATTQAPSDTTPPAAPSGVTVN